MKGDLTVLFNLTNICNINWWDKYNIDLNITRLKSKKKNKYFPNLDTLHLLKKTKNLCNESDESNESNLLFTF